MQKTFFQRSSNQNKYQSLVAQMNLLEERFKLLSEIELQTKSNELKNNYEKNPTLNSYLIESFALTREASTRKLGLRHFDVQLIGGLVLNDKKIAEMGTGEGKTLVATLPASLNALTRKGVHIVTVNDYLAARDQLLMGQLYKFLGLSTGLIQSGMSKPERRINYNTDITYVTNYELAFDYLRDNMSTNIEETVLRDFNYCIVDEVDSILIDEAQTPLIISNNVETPIKKYIMADELIPYLERNIHYQVDEKNKNVMLLDEGSHQIETLLESQDLYNISDPWITYIINAIKARSLFLKNVNYIVQNNRVVIVDEFTGRIMPDRRWSDGLHQAIEAKEKLPICQNTETVATITYQNFFLLYPKLSGMTGTGKTSEIEFEKIYNLSVEIIPTAKINKRLDLPDLIYKDQFSKWNAVAKACDQIVKTKQPILIGTTTVEKSEMLAQLLTEYNLPYQLLNAKPENVRRESEIIAQAGQKHMITIATNMAGRGTDIMLGGNINFIVQKELYDILTLAKRYVTSENPNLRIFKAILTSSSYKFLSVLLSILKNENFLRLSDVHILKVLHKNDKIQVPKNLRQSSIQFLINELNIHYRKNQLQESQIVKNLGGLYIIGTERNNSRRIDNQLRGRCGRQGDPGTSRFFLSLDDNLLRLFGGPKIRAFMQSQILDDLPLESSFLTKSLDSAQQKIEERSYQNRKNLFDYDEILNSQRKLIYMDRKLILKNQFSEKNFLSFGEQIITEILLEAKRQRISQLNAVILIQKQFGLDLRLQHSIFKNMNILTSKSYFFTEFWLAYETKSNRFASYTEEITNNIERNIILTAIDQIWRDNLQEMNLLRDAVSWRTYGQRNPLSEYKKGAGKMFGRKRKELRFIIINDFLRSSIL